MRVGVSLSAIEAWTERKIKRKMKREKISRKQARAGFSWDVEDWRHEESSDVDGEFDEGAEEVVEEEEGGKSRGATGKRGFEVGDQVESLNGGQGLKPERTMPTQRQAAVEARPVKRAKLQRGDPEPQINTSAVEKEGRPQRQLISLKEDAGYDADAEE